MSFVGTVFVDGGAPNGLPAATSVTSTDLIIVSQGGTPGVPGTAVDRAAPISAVLASAGAGLAAETAARIAADALLAPKVGPSLVSPIIITGLPNSDAGLVSGQLYLNGTFLCVKP
jgi:hypothetical protein